MAVDPNLPDWFFKSYIPSTHEVLGKKLEPLSLNHLLYLNAIDSPLLNDPKKVTFSDLLTGVLVCSTRLPVTEIDHLEARFNPTKFSPERALGLKPYPRFCSIPRWRKHAVYLQRKEPKVFALERIKFNEYLEQSIDTGKTHEDDRGAKKNPLPWIQNQIVTIGTAYNWSRNEILNLSYAEASTHMRSIRYSQTGYYNVITTEEADQIDFVKSLGNVDEQIKALPEEAKRRRYVTLT